jgi:hypothetical protein
MTRPWSKLARSAVRLKQSFSQLKVESLHSAHEAQLPVPRSPLNILDSDDMLVILNSRATVLLNISFRTCIYSKRVVILASLARFLFATRKNAPGGLFRITDSLDREATKEEQAWMVFRMLQIIRDDIYQLLTRASHELVEAERQEQQRHINIFNRSVATWQHMMNKQIKSARGHDHLFESRHYFPGRMAAVRAKCEG